MRNHFGAIGRAVRDGRLTFDHAQALSDVANPRVTDAEGTPLPRAAVDVWGCDPDIWAVMVDHMGIPVDVGHTSRLATLAQRRAIAIRDGGGTFPGCDAPIAWCDRRGVTHRDGWTMTLDDRQVPTGPPRQGTT